MSHRNQKPRIIEHRAPKRKRGGQPGNQNALKHGFYSDKFDPDELALVAAFTQDPTVDDELWLQRVLNRRLLGFIGKREDSTLTLEQLCEAAKALAIGTGRVARLLRDRQALSGEAADGLMGAIAYALDQFGNELHLDL